MKRFFKSLFCYHLNGWEPTGNRFVAYSWHEFCCNDCGKIDWLREKPENVWNGELD